jgi:hypothetical protein
MTTIGGTLEWTAARRPTGSTWLISPAGDFWLACAGGGVVLLAVVVILQWHGDRELDTADLLLSELHLGATYDAIVRGRVWRRMPFDVIAMPIAIVALTCALMLGGHGIVVATAAVYLGAWHRGRQNFGVARYYQASTGGPLSQWHRWLFASAVYAPMIAGVAFFTSTSPLHEGEKYARMEVDTIVLYVLGIAAATCVVAYLTYAFGNRERIHPGERWLVTAHALAFGSAYVLGAWSVSFILVLALHHEVQYLYFTYAMARRGASRTIGTSLGELRLLASFAIWPLIGLGSWLLCQQFDSEWIAPFLVSGLMCHYWLDSRIWTSRARRPAAVS